MDIIYLDNSATTPICKEASDAMRLAMECYANPSSLHFFGHNAEKMVNEARKNIIRLTRNMFIRLTIENMYIACS